MEKPVLTLKSSIHPTLKQSVLFRGTILASLGLAAWLFGAIFLSITTLMVWGWLILIFGGVLITLGLLPYRKLTRIENNPNEVVVTDLEELNFYMQGKPLLRIPLEKIEEIAFLDDEKRYGIGLWVEQPMKSSVTELNPTLDLAYYQNECQKKYFCDIFLPFFTKRSFDELENIRKEG